ncbi:ATP-dependent DNA helicase RecG [Patescibacteria group bacterium]|nr:ATP-dependent DNA helicase RecG [Patescibacteria group bacterium]MBU1705724.1 ATP-dependent DNA helicase RecG [Patescibacteria group bacterium]
MAIHLSTSVAALPGIGAGAAKDLKNLGVVCVRDLLEYFPFRYDDFSKIKAIADLRHGDTVTVTGRIRAIESRQAKNRRLTLTEAIVEDGTGEIKVIWFNQPYLEKTLSIGKVVSLAGTVDSKFGKTLVNPIYEAAHTNIHTGRIVPVYGRTGALTIRRLRGAMQTALAAADEIVEWLPGKVRGQEHWPDEPEALRAVHFPKDNQELARAIERLKFDELFLHQMLFAEVRRQKEVKEAKAWAIDESYLKEFVQRLPFELTTDQKMAVWEIVQDCAKDHPMNRLLEGDVGSGKTVVAAMALAHAIKQGGKAAYLAPTEILAKQVHQELSKYLSGVEVALFTAGQVKLGQEEISRNNLLALLARGDCACVVGTQTLIQEGVSLPDLGLIVIDEQHRFGVRQRHALLETGDRPAPHLLSMTATPIPRSLALTLYGDLQLSIIRQKPKGRKPIATRIAFEKAKAAMWQQVEAEIKNGHRAYVICPLIDPSDKLGTQSVTETAQVLSKGVLKKVKVGILHGKLKSDEKEQVMNDFKSGRIEVLVATTVVEVGVDVPDATMMVILGAERFGLAQLHQLRGRVGRSERQSYCYLAPETFSSNTKERLMAMVHCEDGFELAERDLQLRGAGNVFGTAQSGFPDFKLATVGDADLIKKAHEWAQEILAKDPHLDRKPLLRQKIDDALAQAHLE